LGRTKAGPEGFMRPEKQTRDTAELAHETNLRERTPYFFGGFSRHLHLLPFKHARVHAGARSRREFARGLVGEGKR
jgi:hypothetical protein